MAPIKFKFCHAHSEKKAFPFLYSELRAIFPLDGQDGHHKVHEALGSWTRDNTLVHTQALVVFSCLVDF